jgi:glutaminyl-tRNA synthetase
MYSQGFLFAEPSISEAKLNKHFQFLRKGYYCLDKDSDSGKLIFNRTVTLKDGWAKQAKKNS